MLFCEFHGVRQLDSTFVLSAFVRHFFFFFLEKRKKEEKLIKDRDRERVIEGSGVDRPIRLEDKQLDRQRNFSIFFLCVFTFLISETCNALRINTALFNQSVPSVLSSTSKINILMLDIIFILL